MMDLLTMLNLRQPAVCPICGGPGNPTAPGNRCDTCLTNDCRDMAKRQLASSINAAIAQWQESFSARRNPRKIQTQIIKEVVQDLATAHGVAKGKIKQPDPEESEQFEMAVIALEGLGVVKKQAVTAINRAFEEDPELREGPVEQLILAALPHAVNR